MHQIGYYVAEWQMKKEFFMQRKEWARELLSRLGLKNPGDTTSGTFAELQYAVKIGPRGGVQITGILPWQINWRWFREQRETGISWRKPENWFCSQEVG